MCPGAELRHVLGDVFGTGMVRRVCSDGAHLALEVLVEMAVQVVPDQHVQRDEARGQDEAHACRETQRQAASQGLARRVKQ